MRIIRTFSPLKTKIETKSCSSVLGPLCFHIEILRWITLPPSWSANINNWSKLSMSKLIKYVILASCKTHLHFHNCLGPNMKGNQYRIRFFG